MTNAETKRFYEQDRKDYEIIKNKDFLKWLNGLMKDGYHCYINVKELQELIDNIVNWYEFKYPERKLESKEGTTDIRFKDIRNISSVMDIKQLLFRLPNDQLSLIECGYRAGCYGQYPIYENNKVVGFKTHIGIKISKKNASESNLQSCNTTDFLLTTDHITGKVLNNYDIREYIDGKENIKIDELLSIFENKYNNQLDFDKLKVCVFNHNCDMELRNKILEFAALKLLYSRNTTPERGYERAKRFICEFNKGLGLNLSIQQIFDIIIRDYTSDKKLGSINKVRILREKNS